MSARGCPCRFFRCTVETCPCISKTVSCDDTICKTCQCFALREAIRVQDDVAAAILCSISPEQIKFEFENGFDLLREAVVAKLPRTVFSLLAHGVKSLDDRPFEYDAIVTGNNLEELEIELDRFTKKIELPPDVRRSYERLQRLSKDEIAEIRENYSKMLESRDFERYKLQYNIEREDLSILRVFRIFSLGSPEQHEHYFKLRWITANTDRLNAKEKQKFERIAKNKAAYTASTEIAAALAWSGALSDPIRLGFGSVSKASTKISEAKVWDWSKEIEKMEMAIFTLDANRIVLLDQKKKWNVLYRGIRGSSIWSFTSFEFASLHYCEFIDSLLSDTVFSRATVAVGENDDNDNDDD